MKSWIGLSLLASLLGTACAGAAEPPDASDDDGAEFESANPSAADDQGDDAGDDAEDDDTATDDGNEPPDADPDEDPTRAIEEADIIKIEGDHLFALSPYGGLSIVEISDPARMRLLGRFKVEATPFEMYVRDGIAMVIYNGYGEYTYDSDAESWNWHQSSYVIAVDTSAQPEPTEVGRFQVPGTISDSRVVGDVLYVVTFEDGYCWRCDDVPTTHLLSLDVSQPEAIIEVDELSFEERQGTYSWQRSVTATNERLYVAGPTWSDSGPTGSTLQVVDISDATGQMTLGASVEVEGQIQSRWQMDEYEGVLRVVSQPFSWREDDQAPRVETFQIESAQSLEPLGALAMQIPANETLRAVRFDGPRAYAITAEQMDPLFTLDLSDPSDPKQVGELQMPGWVYHMEPRGERVLGLGYDQGNPDGAITVSLFDVSSLAEPKLLERVNFGGDWGSLAEDQDRIHKAFSILPDAGLLLVPFSGWSYDDTEQCYSGNYLSGVQLIDWADDTLRLRGVAEAQGRARRAFIHDQRLLTMSDDRIESFEIEDRDEPASLDRVSLALRADMAASDGQSVARIGYDWYSGSVELTVSALEDTGTPDRGVIVPLPQVEREQCNGYSYLNQMLATTGRVYLQYHEYHWDDDGTDKGDSARVITVDTSDPENPSVLGDAKLDFVPSYGFGYVPGLVDSGTSLLARDWGLIFSYRAREWDSQGNIDKDTHTLELVDMTEPDAPKTRSLELPESQGSTGLLASGTLLALSHFVQSPTNPGKVRFYLDRVDLKDPHEPKLLPPVNTPGSLLAYDAVSDHALTLDYQAQTTRTTARRCYEELDGQFEVADPNAPYDYEKTEGACRFIQQTLHLLQVGEQQARVLDSYEFARGEHVGLTASSGQRLFVSLGQRYYGYAEDDSALEPGSGGDQTFESTTAPLFVFGGIRSSALQMGRIELETGDMYQRGFAQLAASGAHAVVSAGFRGKLSVIDASDISEPRLQEEFEVPGWVSDLDLADDTAIACLGYDGIAAVKLND